MIFIAQRVSRSSAFLTAGSYHHQTITTPRRQPTGGWAEARQTVEITRAITEYWDLVEVEPVELGSQLEIAVILRLRDVEERRMSGEALYVSRD
jgi:hypothetical protein